MTGRVEQYTYDLREVLGRLDPEDKLHRYFQLLESENRRINLVSRETSLEGLRLLAAESLFPITLVETDRFISYLDIGSGGGFPAVPILLTHEIDDAVLVERTQKKAGALRRMLLALEKRAEIYPEPFERFDPGGRRFDLITLRLVALDRPLLERILPLIGPSGTFIYWGRCEHRVDPAQFVVREISFNVDNSSDVHAATILRRH